MRTYLCVVVASFAVLVVMGSTASETIVPNPTVGSAGAGNYLVATGQYIKPEGDTLAFFGRPSDVAFDPNHIRLAVKNSHGIIFVNKRNWRIVQNLPLPELDLDFPQHLGGNGPAGILWSPDSKEVWTTDSFGWVLGAKLGAHERFHWSDRSPLPSPNGSLIFRGDKNATDLNSSAPIGLAWDTDNRTMFVALSRDNAIAALDSVTHRILYRIQVGNAPFGIVRVGHMLYVSNWAGRRADGRHQTADSSGTAIQVDPMTGSASSGTVSIVALTKRQSIEELSVGLHPSAIIAAKDGSRVYVANSNSDTISIIDTATQRVVRTISLGESERFGRTPTSLGLADDGKTLYVAEGGANDIAVIDVAHARIRAHIAAGWYPAALALDGPTLYVADLKGAGSRAKDFHLNLPAATIAQRRGRADGYNSYDYAGMVQRIRPGAKRSQPDTWVASDASGSRRLARFKHVLYIVAENHTYDDYFGDVAAGRGDPRLCAFCGNISPNHHALAGRFGLFDNFYVNSILSADGHNWAVSSYASDYIERSLSGWGRSYPSAGNDPLAYSPEGFIWNRILARGLTFRDYGEFIPDESKFDPPNPTWRDFYNDY